MYESKWDEAGSTREFTSSQMKAMVGLAGSVADHDVQIELVWPILGPDGEVAGERALVLELSEAEAVVEHLNSALRDARELLSVIQVGKIAAAPKREKKVAK
jgi:hypothetical protein